MDTLSSSVPTLQVAVLHSTPREFYYFRAPSTSQQLPQHHSHLSTTKLKRTSTSFSRMSLTLPILSSSGTSSPKLASPYSHQKPASGYAAALLDKALCHSSHEAVQKDVQRLSRLPKNKHLRAIFADPLVGEKEKDLIVKEVVNMGKVNRYLACLLRMLIERNKMAMVSEVLEEFERIYDDLIGTRVVVVSSVKRMEKDELFVIAKGVQELGGDAKVKIRNLVDERGPSVAV